ncbi:MAG: hypothetical protein JOY64_19945 [Alphaproteobacteria bacterium]|nr:hypothetical protein [Alphaproteobacteria bacterium]
MIGLASGEALAQGGDDPIERLRACGQLPPTARLECLDKLSRDVGPSPSPGAAPSSNAPTEVPPAANDWTVSETTSPLDYTPVATATASYIGGSGGVALQLSIQCRGGRTELAISAPTLKLRPEDYVVSYVVNNGGPVVVGTGMPSSGIGLAVRVDVVRLLVSLPERGELAFRVNPRQGAALEGRYALPGLKLVRDRLAASCGWPITAAPARN